LWRRLLAASPFILVSLLITLLYADSALFRKLETGALDLRMFFNKSPEDSNVVIVRITDADYRNHFGGKSPLDPVKLREIIGVIAAAKPKVIGIALDTSASEFQTLDIPPGWPPVVWARGSVYSNVRRKHLLSGALGRQSPSASCGLVAFKLDTDGAIRRYARWYDTDAGAAPSLPWAVLRKFRNDESRADAAPDFEEEFLIDYPGPPDSYHFLETTVAALLDPRRSAWADDNIFKDNMVLLGGDYAAQDEHDTPVGWMLGVEILASVIETEQRGVRRKPFGIAEITLLTLAAGVVLLLLIHMFVGRKALLLGVVFIVAGALVCGLLLLGSLYYVGHFLLVLVAVLLHQAYEWGKDYLGKRREQATDELKVKTETGKRAEPL
jgi:CHASE2 domain-containing sensor protein